MSRLLRHPVYTDDVEIPEEVDFPSWAFALAGLTDDQRAAVLAHLNGPYCGYGCGGRAGCRCGDDS